MNQKKDLSFVVGGCLVLIALAIVLSAFTALIFMFAWNLVMPTLFDLPELGFFQSWAFLFVIHIALGYIRGFVAAK